MNEPSLRLRLTVWYTLALLVTLCLGACLDAWLLSLIIKGLTYWLPVGK